MSLQARERMVLMVGGVIVALILFYALILFPWHRALNEMTQRLPALRQDVVWMRVHGEALANGEIKNQAPQYRGAEQSLLSVIEQTASRTKVRDTIQQLVPDNNGAEVRVVLEDAQFNLWLQWIDVLYKQYGVDISQLTVEKEDERPNIAEIRVTFSR
jgi:Type II secretory pathway, component PulM